MTIRELKQESQAERRHGCFGMAVALERCAERKERGK
jgi:hypothetical protein